MGRALVLSGSVCLLTFVAVSCEERPQTSASPTTQAAVVEPAVVQSLRALWESDAKRHANKMEYSRAQGELYKAVRASIDSGSLDDIQNYVQASVGSGSPSEIARELQYFLLGHLMMAKPDRDRLVRLLASGSTDRSSFWCIEEDLTQEETAERLPDSFGVLFDAFNLAETGHAKDANYFAVWRALGDLPIKTTDQAEYMKVAQSWYRDNRSRLVRQKRYDHDEFLWWREGNRQGTEPPHLFTLAK